MARPRASGTGGLTAVAIANYNAQPHTSLGGRSPLETLGYYIDQKRIALRWLAEPVPRHLCLLQHRMKVTCVAVSRAACGLTRLRCMVRSLVPTAQRTCCRSHVAAIQLPVRPRQGVGFDCTLVDLHTAPGGAASMAQRQRRDRRPSGCPGYFHVRFAAGDHASPRGTSSGYQAARALVRRYGTSGTGAALLA